MKSVAPDAIVSFKKSIEENFRSFHFVMSGDITNARRLF